MKTLTAQQAETVKDVLSYWIQDQDEVLGNADNYGLDRDNVVELAEEVNEIAIVLEDVFGVKKAKKTHTVSLKYLNELLENLEDS